MTPAATQTRKPCGCAHAIGGAVRLARSVLAPTLDDAASDRRASVCATCPDLVLGQLGPYRAANCGVCGCFVGLACAEGDIRFEPEFLGRREPFVGVAFGKTRLDAEACPRSIDGTTWGPGPRARSEAGP